MSSVINHPKYMGRGSRPRPQRDPEAELGAWHVSLAVSMVQFSARAGNYIDACRYIGEACEAGLRGASSDILLAIAETQQQLIRWHGRAAMSADPYHPPEGELQAVLDFWQAIWAAYWRPSEDEWLAAGEALCRATVEWGLRCWADPRDASRVREWRRHYDKVQAACKRAEGLS